MNRKGFTLVEMLAVIAIMGILSGIAIMGVSKYLSDSKDKAYKSIIKSAYSASTNYILDNNISISSGDSENISFDTLIEKGYMETPVDPNNRDTSCTGNVKVENNSSDDSDIDSYKYEVNLNCSGSDYQKTETFSE